MTNPTTIPNAFQCVGKVPHASKKAAEKARRGLASRPGFKSKGRPPSIYRCPSCNAWHVGSSMR